VTNTEKEYFHATLSGCIQEFRPLSHFGTQEAAFETCLRKWINYRRQCHAGIHSVVAPYEVKVKINVNSQALLRVDMDWGSPNILGIVRGLREHYRVSGRTDLFDQLSKILRSNPPRSIVRDALWRFTGTPLEAFLNEQGIKVISYPNSIEGKRGEESICVIDPGVIQYSSAKQIHLEDLNAAAEPLRRYEPFAEW